MLSVEDLGQEIAELAARMDAATHRLLECIRQFDASNEWYAQGAVSCAHWLSWRIGLDLATAREKVRVARALGTLPAIDQALRVGRISYAKVRAMTRVAKPENEGQLLEFAIYATGAQLERICRGYRGALAADRPVCPEDRSVRRRVLPGGMVKVEMVLCPDEADLVMRAIDCAREVGHANAQHEPAPDAAVATRKCDNDHGHVSAEDCKAAKNCKESAAWPSRPDGAVALAEGFLANNAAKGNGGERYQVMVNVDQDVLAPDGTMAATLEDGTHISAETFRRIACDCGLIAQGGHDELSTLSIGRRSRSIPAAIRRALRLRDRGCRFPGCTHDRFLHGHHIQHWLHGGETSVENLIQLCTRHHHLVHEGGWSIERNEAGEWKFVDPAGKAVRPSEASQAWTGKILTWLQEWADEHGLDLGPDSNAPLWDGTRPDYDLAVAGLQACR